MVIIIIIITTVVVKGYHSHTWPLVYRDCRRSSSGQQLQLEAEVQEREAPSQPESEGPVLGTAVSDTEVLL